MTRFTNIIAAEIRPICAAFRAGSIEVPQGVAILMLRVREFRILYKQGLS